LNKTDILQLSSLVLTKAKEYGADLVGIADAAELKNSPSHKLAPQIPRLKVGKVEGGLEPEVVQWPENAKSVIVIGISHPEDKPELDWWHGKYLPPGNQKLARIAKKLGEWINNNYEGIQAYPLPYHVEKGGIYLKDAAVMAGLGCIGLNNLFISPEYGPAVRLRVLIVDKELVFTGPVNYNPCSSCEVYCLKKCPRGAFNEVIYNQEEMGQSNLPGITGTYSRIKCNHQMEKDIKDSRERNETAIYGPDGEEVQLLKYCRNCEFACPVGRVT